MVKIGSLRTLLLISGLVVSQPFHVFAAQAPVRINEAHFADMLCLFFKKLNLQLDEISKCREAKQALIELRKLKYIELEFEGTGLVKFAAGTCEVACSSLNNRIKGEVLPKLGLLSLNDRYEILSGLRKAIVKFGQHLFTKFDGADHTHDIFASRPAAQRAVTNYNALLSTIDQVLAPLIAQRTQTPVVRRVPTPVVAQPLAPVAPKPVQSKIIQPAPKTALKPTVVPQQPQVPTKQPVAPKKVTPVATPTPALKPEPKASVALKPEQQKTQHSTAIDLQALKDSMQQISALLAAKPVKAQAPVTTPQAQTKINTADVKPVQKPVQQPVVAQTVAKPAGPKAPASQPVVAPQQLQKAVIEKTTALKPAVQTQTTGTPQPTVVTPIVKEPVKNQSAQPPITKPTILTTPTAAAAQSAPKKPATTQSAQPTQPKAAQKAPVQQATNASNAKPVVQQPTPIQTPKTKVEPAQQPNKQENQKKPAATPIVVKTPEPAISPVPTSATPTHCDPKSTMIGTREDIDTYVKKAREAYEKSHQKKQDPEQQPVVLQAPVLATPAAFEQKSEQKQSTKVEAVQQSSAQQPETPKAASPAPTSPATDGMPMLTADVPTLQEQEQEFTFTPEEIEKLNQLEKAYQELASEDASKKASPKKQKKQKPIAAQAPVAAQPVMFEQKPTPKTVTPIASVVLPQPQKIDAKQPETPVNDNLTKAFAIPNDPQQQPKKVGSAAHKTETVQQPVVSATSTETTPTNCEQDRVFTLKDIAILGDEELEKLAQEAYEKAHQHNHDLALAPQQQDESIDKEAFEIPLCSQALKDIRSKYKEEHKEPIAATKNPGAFIKEFLVPKESDFDKELCLNLAPQQHYSEQNVVAHLQNLYSTLAHNFPSFISGKGRTALQQELNNFELDAKKYDQLSTKLYKRALQSENPATAFTSLGEMFKQAPQEGWKKFIENIQHPYEMVLSLPQPPANVTINHLGDYVQWYLQDFAPSAEWYAVGSQIKFLNELLKTQGCEKTTQLITDYTDHYIQPSLIEELGVL